MLLKRLLAACLFTLGLSVSLFADSPKYVFLFIGDGMGKQQVELGRQAAQYAGKAWYVQGLDEKQQKNLPDGWDLAVGSASTNTVDGRVTDSAASGTAIACGVKTLYLQLGIDKDRKIVKSIGYIAKENGWKVGIITSVGINHATPAAFYAHAENRNQYGQIALEMHLSGFDYFGGETIMKNAEETEIGKTDVPPPLLAEVAENALRDRGYTVLHGDRERKQFMGSTGKLFVSSPGNSYAIVRKPDDNSVTIAGHLETALQLFNGEPFFIMTEGAKIDHASEGNDTGALLSELNEFNDAVGKAFEFAKQHPQDTLIVITADHNSGRLSFLSPEETVTKEQIELIRRQKLTLTQIRRELSALVPPKTPPEERRSLDELIDTVLVSVGIAKSDLTPDDLKKLEDIRSAKNFDPRRFVRVIAARRDAMAGLSWTGPGHFPDPVYVLAFGPDVVVFKGDYENSDVFHKIKGLLAFPGEKKAQEAAPEKNESVKEKEN